MQRYFLGRISIEVITVSLIYQVQPGIGYWVDIWLPKPFCAVEVEEENNQDFQMLLKVP